jgi:hypothetical protein
MNDTFTAQFRHLVLPAYEACVEEKKTGLTGLRRDLTLVLHFSGRLEGQVTGPRAGE